MIFPHANFTYLAGLFEYSHMRYEVDRADDAAGEPSIAEMTEKAIKILQKNPKGYFLLAEGINRSDITNERLAVSTSNTRDSVSSGYLNTENRIKNSTISRVFLTKFEMFG